MVRPTRNLAGHHDKTVDQEYEGEGSCLSAVARFHQSSTGGVTCHSLKRTIRGQVLFYGLGLEV